MKKTVSTIIALLIMAMMLPFSVLAVQTTETEVRYRFGDLTEDWKCLSATEAVRDIPREKRPCVSFSSTSDRLSAYCDFKAEDYSIEKNADSLALMFWLYVNDAGTLGSERSGSDFFYLTTPNMTFRWKISELSLKSGWSLVTLNLRTSEKSEQITEFPTESAVVSNIDANGQETTETVIVQPVYARFGLQSSKKSLNTRIAFDDIRVVTLSMHEDQKLLSPVKDELSPTPVVIAVIIVIAIMLAVAVSCWIYAKNEMRRRRRKRREKKRSLQKAAKENGLFPPDESDFGDE